MGELGGFLKIHRVNGRKRPIPERVRRLRGVRLPRGGAGAARAGRALHGLRHPVLPLGLPARQPDPGLERPRLPRPLAGGDRRAPRHEQLPRVHRPHLPGAVRGRVRARHQRRRGHDQADRAVDHRPRLGGGLGQGRAARRRAAARPSRSIGSGPAGLAAAAGAQPLRPHGHAVRAQHRTRAACCASACPDFKLEKWIVQRRVDQLVEEGVELRCGVDVGRDVTGDELREQFDAIVIADRLDDPARPAGARPRARRRPLRDGVPRDAQPLGRRASTRTARRSRRPASTS